MFTPTIYIISNFKNGTIYVGVTSNLPKRIYEHKNNIISGFSSKYGCKCLVYYEIHTNIEDAILREKQIKSRSRKYKLNLIETMNPDWVDLYDSIC
ncbi:GIY-YIG nuclease family protein [Rickettsiales endosymbiont of Trichoplax sp. H2]|uniref:GIY-YIG nuclease family protein n=1 Tax=Rickettsiales endosymbiont of Trichoplax sp. H2 TaxID=2021221 RepID=UPI0012B26BDD|nr:GIY-YIG nuclease family protein [Rickettsiales endosymbiont of Trichoplax sp. H2]MSO14088.1 UPF0213 protein [Rickettsiales endosymbiont of Trichoplax sp. H2]